MNLRINEIIILFSIGIVFIWVAMVQFQIYKANKEKRQLLKEAKGKDLETLLSKYLQDVSLAKERIKEITEILETTKKTANKSLHKIALIRFNPFKDTGGNQSFVIALLDTDNNGFVISSLHGREGTRVYAKPVASGESSYSLSDEEKQALKKALE